MHGSDPRFQSPRNAFWLLGWIRAEYNEPKEVARRPRDSMTLSGCSRHPAEGGRPSEARARDREGQSVSIASDWLLGLDSSSLWLGCDRAVTQYSGANCSLIVHWNQPRSKGPIDPRERKFGKREKPDRLNCIGFGFSGYSERGRKRRIDPPPSRRSTATRTESCAVPPGRRSAWQLPVQTRSTSRWCLARRGFRD